MSAGRRKCPVCEIFFLPSEEDYNIHTHGKYKNRYFHKECYEKFLEEEGKEEQDRRALLDRIRLELGQERLSQKDFILINKYRKDHNYTYSGMLGSIVYFTEVCGENMTGVGIIPYIYDDAREYFNDLARTQEKVESFEGEAVSVKKIKVKRPEGPKPLKLRKEIDMGDI